MEEEKRMTWQISKRKRKQAHFMESETSAFCGRPLLKTKALPPDWNPMEHLDCVCPTCLEWYRRVRKPCKSGQRPILLPHSTA
jgi:hypothetical protein